MIVEVSEDTASQVVTNLDVVSTLPHILIKCDKVMTPTSCFESKISNEKKGKSEASTESKMKGWDSSFFASVKIA